MFGISLHIQNPIKWEYCELNIAILINKRPVDILFLSDLSARKQIRKWMNE